MATIPAVRKSQPLPPNPFHPQTDPDLHAAYDQCLGYEHDAQAPRDLIYARCLGYLLTEIPIDKGKALAAEEIILCEGDMQKMGLLAEFYINHLIRLFKQDKGKTPAPTGHPSRPSFDDNSAFFAATVESAPKNHRAAKSAALKRDSYKCMVTGDMEAGWYLCLDPAAQAAHTVGTTKTNFCHIFPPSTNWDLDPNEEGHPKTTYAANMWHVIFSFGGISVLDELNGDDIHKLENGLTLAGDLHMLLDELSVWFEEVPGIPNTYLFRSMTPVRQGVPTTPITFTSSSPRKLALPDRRYLKLHAAVCRVAHMSGAAEYLDKYDRDVELISVLARDGSSSELLEHCLQRLVLAC